MTSTERPSSQGHVPLSPPLEWQYPQNQQLPPHSTAGFPPWPPAPVPGRSSSATRTNTSAILALVFAFVFAPLGIVFGLIGRRQIRRTGEGGRGLATAGLILGILFTIFSVLVAVTLIGVVSRTASTLAGEIASARQTADTGPGNIVIKKTDIETRVANMLQPVLGRRPSSVSCAGDLVDPQVGTTTRCAVTMPDGANAGSTVTVSSVTGSDAKLSVQVDALTIYQAELETMVADNLQRDTGTRPTSVSCPGDLANPQAGMTTHCAATNSDGSNVGVAIRVTNVSGTQVGISVKSDGTP